MAFELVYRAEDRCKSNGLPAGAFPRLPWGRVGPGSDPKSTISGHTTSPPRKKIKNILTALRELLPRAGAGSYSRELVPGAGSYSRHTNAEFQSGSYSQRAGAGSYSRHTNAEFQSGSYSQRAGAGSYSRHTNAEFQSGSYSQRAGTGSYSRHTLPEGCLTAHGPGPGSSIPEQTTAQKTLARVPGSQPVALPPDLRC